MTSAQVLGKQPGTRQRVYNIRIKCWDQAAPKGALTHLFVTVPPNRWLTSTERRQRFTAVQGHIATNPRSPLKYSPLRLHPSLLLLIMTSVFKRNLHRD